MPTDDIVQIKVDKHSVGIMGLTQIFEVMAKLDLPADIEHVRDIKEIGKYVVMGTPALLIKVTDVIEIAEQGVFGTPALVFDGDVKCVGKIPKKEELINWLGK